MDTIPLELECHSIRCPYCGEIVDIIVDISVEEQQYIEDCQVCCRPMTLKIALHSSGLGEFVTQVEVLHENEY